MMLLKLFGIMIPIRIKNLAILVLSLGVITAALIILYRHTQGITISMVIEAARITPTHKIALSLLATFGSFCALAAHEVVASNAALAKRLPLRIPILAGAIGNALGNTLSFHAITITAWRYRIYSRTGLSAVDITRITGIAVIGMALGFAGTSAIALLNNTEAMKIVAGNYISQGIGLILIVIIGIAFGVSRRRKQIGIGRFTVSLPDRPILTRQLLIGLVEMSAAVYASYILLPVNAAPSFAHFTIFYIAATLFGIASHTPGGIGVFEAGMMTALAAEGRADILAALLLYRVIYNLLPFVIACIAIAIYEVRLRFSSIKDIA